MSRGVRSGQFFRQTVANVLAAKRVMAAMVMPKTLTRGTCRENR